MKKYVVMLIADITNAQINTSTSNTISQTRLNSVGDKAILKFLDTDDIARSAFINETWYTQQQILDDILTLAEWE